MGLGGHNIKPASRSKMKIPKAIAGATAIPSPPGAVINFWTGSAAMHAPHSKPWMKLMVLTPLIAAPVQTADPDNYGGEIAELGIGFNIAPHR